MDFRFNSLPLAGALFKMIINREDIDINLESSSNAQQYIKNSITTYECIFPAINSLNVQWTKKNGSC